MSNAAGTPSDITVLDANNNYAVIGSYNVMLNGSEAFTAVRTGGSGVRLPRQPLGNRPGTRRPSSTSRATRVCTCALDIPWLSENPTTGTVGAGLASGGRLRQHLPGRRDLRLTGLLPGLRQAQLQIQTDTPYAVPGIPVTLTVRFLDVPDDNQFQAYIYGVAGAGVMFGGPPVCSDNLNFCPNGFVTRADMAGYLFRAVHGANTPPPVYQNNFVDVSFNDYNAFYIQGILDDGVTAGCHANPISTARTCRSRAPRCRSWSGRISTARRRLRPARESSPTCRVPTGSRWTTSRVSSRGRDRGCDGLHRESLPRGRDRGMRRRELLPEHPDHERADVGLPGQGFRHSVPAVRRDASISTGAAPKAAPVFLCPIPAW